MFFDPLEDKERKATIKTKMPCAEHLRMRENSIIINNCFLGKKGKDLNILSQTC